TVDRLRNHDDAEIRELADKVFPATTDGRLEVLEKYSPALELKGDAGTGREIYSARCMICHRSGELGFAYGPDVASFRASGKQSILSNLIDPAREIQPQFAIQEITLKNGARMVGRITDQGEDQIQLLLPAGVEQSIGRETVVKIQVLPNSPMPEGLESGLSVQQMADLLEFLTRPE
ncbi:MAG: putative heme-binding domain-containing protein, partial [Verrucomicrobiales bacterium]